MFLRQTAGTEGPSSCLEKVHLVRLRDLVPVWVAKPRSFLSIPLEGVVFVSVTIPVQKSTTGGLRVSRKE